MPKDFCIVLNTCPDEATAKLIAASLVDERLAACVNILPGICSVYRWAGQREMDQEYLLLIKSRRDVYADIEARIKELHPYDVPEIISTPILAGSKTYLDWLDQSVSKP